MTITKQNTYLTLTGLILLFIGGFIASSPSAYLLQFTPETQTSIEFAFTLAGLYILKKEVKSWN